MPCSNLGPVKKQKKGSSPETKQHSQALGMPDPAEVLSSGVSQGEQGGRASSWSSDEEEGGEQMTDVVQELEEEVQRLHDQVPCRVHVSKCCKCHAHSYWTARLVCAKLLRQHTACTTSLACHECGKSIAPECDRSITV